MELKKYKMKDIVTFLNGRAYLMPELQDKGKYRILRVGNLSGGNDSWYYSDMELDENKYCENGDLLYAWACTFGPHLWKEEKVIYHYHVWKLIENKERVDKLYLYYYLLHQTPLYLGGVNGATMVHITKQNMEKKTVYIPASLYIQQKISSILSSYDRLIENNTRRIRLLEQMAENLYKEWFVRFRFPEHEKVEMVNGLPEGWIKEELSNIADVCMGSSPKSEYYNEEKKGLPFHQGVGSFGERFVLDNTYSTSYSQIAEPMSILFSVRAPVGRLNYTRNRIVIGRGIAAINHKEGMQSLLFYTLKTKFFKEDIIGNGAIFSSITKKELLKLKLIVPNKELRVVFNNKINKIDREIDILYKQNQLLTRQRDLLLPRLMSGKLEVKS